jgi:hypothetical protein
MFLRQQLRIFVFYEGVDYELELKILNDFVEKILRTFLIFLKAFIKQNQTNYKLLVNPIPFKREITTFPNASA